MWHQPVTLALVPKAQEVLVQKAPKAQAVLAPRAQEVLAQKAQKAQEVLAPDGSKTTFYVNPDKNGAMVRMEILSKKLIEVIRELCPSKEFFLRRNEGTIFVDRRPLVRVVVESQESTVLSWKHQKRVAINLDDSVVETKFKELQKDGGGDPWS